MIRLEAGNFVIPNDPAKLEQIRSLPVRKWSAKDDTWLVPYTAECYRMLLDHGFKVRHLEKPTTYGYEIGTYQGTNLTISTLLADGDVDKCRGIPEYRRFDGELRVWVFRPTTANVTYIKGAFPKAHWTDEAKALISGVSKSAKMKMPPINDFKFRLQPFPHQLEDFHRSREREFYGFFWDQGTGKTKMFIDTFAYNAQKGKVRGLLVVVPNAVKSTWQDDELPTHFPSWLKMDLFVWDTATKAKASSWILRDTDGVKVMIMNVEALSHESGVRAATQFVGRWDTMIAIDESSIIGSHKAKRTKAIIKIGEKAKVRRIGDGTPATESPMEFFAQCLFLSPKIFGKNFYAFRNRYAKMGGWQGKQIVGYQNLEELQMIIDEHSSRYLKSDVFKDLPDQMFARRVVQLTPEQQRIYNDLRDELKAETKKGTFQVEHTITKLLRLHQICGGFLPQTMFTVDQETGEVVPVEHDIPPAIHGTNPKLEELLSIGRQTHDKIIVYCRFRPEMDLITKTLREIYGRDAVVEMRGGMKQEGHDGRRESKRRFQEDPSVRWMVAQSRAAGRGLTLTACHTVVYFSNDFSLRIRLQSQDRVHRFGQKENVLYIDLVAEKTIDEHLLKTLRKKKNLADLVNGDPTLSWL